MADSKTELSVKDLQALDPKALQELHNKYGLEVQIRSNSTAINQILTSLGRTVSADSAFTRGFDRTSPGYDRYYDRDNAQMRPGEEVINPAVTLGQVLKTLSAEQLAELKKGQR